MPTTARTYACPSTSLPHTGLADDMDGCGRWLTTQLESLPETPTVPVAHSQTLGLKVYEFSNHLGNVLTTFSDRKIPTEGTPGYVAYYTAEILSSTDYYPFGFQTPGRVYEGDGYRYGFNGQEKVDEIAGSANSYTAEFWQYDPRIGRRWNLDPVVKIHESPYACFANNPIWFMDPNGSDTVRLEDGTLGYQVEPGDSPSSIASITGVSKEELARLNYGRDFDNNSHFAEPPTNGNWTEYWAQPGESFRVRTGDVFRLEPFPWIEQFYSTPYPVPTLPVDLSDPSVGFMDVLHMVRYLATSSLPERPTGKDLITGHRNKLLTSWGTNHLFYNGTEVQVSIYPDQFRKAAIIQKESIPDPILNNYYAHEIRVLSETHRAWLTGFNVNYTIISIKFTNHDQELFERSWKYINGCTETIP
jgi:RHS repeat-associated protein